MKISEGFSVEITSDYKELWRYNLAVTCGCFDDEGKGEDNPRRDFIAAEDTIAPTGSNLKACPTDYPSQRGISFTTTPCDYLMLYVYVIPHSLPQDRIIEHTKPFKMRIRITRGKAVVCDTDYNVNSWAGESIELKVQKD